MRFGENSVPVKETLGEKRKEGKGKEVGGVYWRQYFWVFGVVVITTLWSSQLGFGMGQKKCKIHKFLEYECGWLVV
jgi:hypothetical protein